MIINRLKINQYRPTFDKKTHNTIQTRKWTNKGIKEETPTKAKKHNIIIIHNIIYNIQVINNTIQENSAYKSKKETQQQNNKKNMRSKRNK